MSGGALVSDLSAFNYEIIQDLVLVSFWGHCPVSVVA